MKCLRHDVRRHHYRWRRRQRCMSTSMSSRGVRHTHRLHACHGAAAAGRYHRSILARSKTDVLLLCHCAGRGRPRSFKLVSISYTTYHQSDIVTIAFYLAPLSKYLTLKNIVTMKSRLWVTRPANLRMIGTKTSPICADSRVGTIFCRWSIAQCTVRSERRKGCIGLEGKRRKVVCYDPSVSYDSCIIEIGTNQKPICDFLLVFHCNYSVCSTTNSWR